MATKRAVSIEDGDLTYSFNTGRISPYKDIDLSLSRNFQGDVYRKLDAESVKQGVKNLLMTNQLEKPFRPDFGADLQSLMFDLADPTIEIDIENKIEYAIRKYEPRALLEKVTAKARPDENSVFVTVVFSIINTAQRVTLSTTITRLR
jgi:phage baseplate assembly protein W